MHQLPEGCLVKHPASLIEDLVAAAQRIQQGDPERALLATVACHHRVHELIAGASILAGQLRPGPAEYAPDAPTILTNRRLSERFIEAGSRLDSTAIRNLITAHCGACTGHGDVESMIVVL